MLETRIIPDANQFGQALTADLQQAKNLAIAVAFAKESALPVVDVEAWCGSGRALRFLAGTDYALTELQLLRRLEISGNAQCRIYHAMGPRIFHPKLYILEHERKRVVYIGSSNFTRGGLAENVEVNVRLEGAVGTSAVDKARQLFDSMFEGEFVTPISPEFESGYRELQEAMRSVQAYPSVPEAAQRLRIAESMLLGRYRARVAVRRWLLVASPENYEICLRERVWGRQNEHEIRGYAPGDVFLFHITNRRRIAAFGLFTGKPFYEAKPLWPANRRGIFPWRIRLLILGELRTGIPTREILEPLRRGAPKNWFHGFIQQSHELSAEDFSALREEFEAALRTERPSFEVAG